MINLTVLSKQFVDFSLTGCTVLKDYTNFSFSQNTIKGTEKTVHTGYRNDDY